MNLRNRILLVLLTASLVFTAALGWLVYRDSVRHMERELAREAEQLASLSTQRLVQEQERLSAKARLLAEFPEIREGVLRDHSRSLNRVFGVVADAARLDLLLVQQPDGDTLAAWPVSPRPGVPPFRAAIPTPGHGMLLTVDDELAHAVAEPVRDGERVLGFVTAGAFLNQDFLDDMAASTEANLVLFLDEKPYRSTSSLGDNWEMIRQWTRLPPDTVTLGDGEWQVVVSAPLALVSERVRLGVLVSRAEYQQQVRSARDNTLMVVLGAALALGIAGLIFANWLVAPLARLTEAARRVAAGEAGVPVPGGGVGEIADLSRAFNTMVQAVQSRDAELQRRMGDLQTLREGASDAIFILDLDGRILSANGKACEWSGRPLSVLEGLNVFDVMHVDAGRPHLSGIVTAEGVKDAWQGEVGGVFQAALAPPGGERVPVEISGGLVPGVEPPVIQLFARDLRERQSLQDQLLQAQKLEAIGTLAGGIAHDFNNLLTGIGGHTQLARMDLPPEHPAQESLTVVEEAVERGANLCRQLLGAARKGRREMRRVNLNTVVEEAVHLCQQTFSPAIGWDIRLAEPLPGVQADAGQVHQVLMNLLVNARDAIGDRQGLLTLSTVAGSVGAGHALVRSGQLPAGDYVMLTVMDSGPGIPREHLTRIFDPFFTTKEAGKGTGLGLSTVFGILREHGGAVEVATREGEGTAFTCYFPAETTPAPLPPPAAGPETDTRPAVTGQRILVVDDEESIRELIHSILGTCGHQVVTAENGLRALDLLDALNGSGLPDLAVLDMLMPGMNGRDTALALRQRIPDLPILFITGYMGEDTNLEVPGGPSPRLLNKPFRTTQLIAVVNEMLAEMLAEKLSGMHSGARSETPTGALARPSATPDDNDKTLSGGKPGAGQ